MTADELIAEIQARLKHLDRQLCAENALPVIVVGFRVGSYTTVVCSLDVPPARLAQTLEDAAAFVRAREEARE